MIHCDMKDKYVLVEIFEQRNMIQCYIVQCEIIPSQYSYSKLYRCTTKIIEK